MSQRLKEWAITHNPSILDDNLRLDPDYDQWADEYDNETQRQRECQDDEQNPF